MALTKKQRTPKNDEGRMSLGEHLRELRNRLVITALTVLVLSIVGWFVYDQVFELLYVPFVESRDIGNNVQINIGGVAGTFETRLRLSAYVGVALSMPMMLFQAWRFITPGLHRNERRIGIALLLTSSPLFIAGVCFGYLAITRAVPILQSFGPSRDVYQLVEFRGYIELVAKTCMMFGLSFVYPVFLVALNMVGLLPVRTMIKGWRWAIFLSFLFTAIMVPTPEPTTLLIVTSPFILLFFGAVGVAAILEKRRNARARKAAAELSVDEASTIDEAPAPIELPKTIDEAYSESGSESETK